MSDNFNTSLSVGIVLLCLAYITLVSSGILPDETSGSRQWDGRCGSVGGLTCGHEVSFYCEQETGYCVECTDTVCKKDGFDDEKCERRCPEWYAKNIPKPTIPPVSKQWQGNCGRVEGLTCGEVVNYYCEQETGICLLCTETFCSKDTFNEQKCAAVCPEWYSLKKKSETTHPSMILQNGTTEIIQEDTEDNPQTSNTTAGATEMTTNNSPDKTVHSTTSIQWVLYVAPCALGVVLIILFLIIIQKMKTKEGRDRRVHASGERQAMNPREPPNKSNEGYAGDCEMGLAYKDNQIICHPVETDDNGSIPEPDLSDDLSQVAQQPRPDTHQSSFMCDTDLTTHGTARNIGYGKDNVLPVPVPVSS